MILIINKEKYNYNKLEIIKAFNSFLLLPNQFSLLSIKTLIYHILKHCNIQIRIMFQLIISNNKDFFLHRKMDSKNKNVFILKEIINPQVNFCNDDIILYY